VAFEIALEVRTLTNKSPCINFWWEEGSKLSRTMIELELVPYATLVSGQARSGLSSLMAALSPQYNQLM